MQENGDQYVAVHDFNLKNCEPAEQGRGKIFSILERVDQITDEPDTMVLIQRMLDLMIEVNLAESANFFQLDTTTDELIITAVRGKLESQNIIGLRLNREQALPGISISGKQPIVIGDTLSDPYWLHTVDPENAALKYNVINLPFATTKHTLGVVQIFNFERAELDLLMVMSNRFANEIQHRIELNSAHQSNQRLWTLVDVLGETAGTLDRNSLLRQVTENTSRLVDAERSSIFLVDPQTNEMIFQVAYRSPNQNISEATSNGFDNSLAQQKPLNAPLVGQQSSEFGYFNRSAITVPIRNTHQLNDQAMEHEQALGGLMALNKPNASFHEEDALVMQVLANQTSTFLQIAEMYESAGELFLGVIKALAAAIDAKDPYTQGHSHRVSDYAVLISKELGLDETLVNDIRIGSLLHDIGKIGIPDSILLKTGKLTSEEYAVMQQHPSKGMNIMNKVKLFEPMLPAIAEHHERLDGSGYPSKLTDRQISLMGKIVAVADVFDAMTTHRPYRPAISITEVLSYLREQAGTLFDSNCVQALDNILAQSNYTDVVK